ncbi:MAG: hypothetical protein LC627_02815, partial [Verrucomicrobiaceae bacterium]|nr:hypothetical protein [Verrucomicrobiaceae bacterium]
IEARAQRFVRDYPEVPVHEVRVEDLNNTEIVGRLFSQLRITPTERTWELIGRPANLKTARKEKFQNPTTLELCRERIEQYLDRAEKAGIKVPETIAFERAPQSS